MSIIVLCADDYAISPGVSSAIFELLEGGRLSATSCMTVSPWWEKTAETLEKLHDSCDIGLHLTLTNFKPLGNLSFCENNGNLPSFSRLLTLAFSDRLPRQEIKQEFIRQWRRFEQLTGKIPAFIDGHQHVQQLPVIQDVVIDLILELGKAPCLPYLRVAWDSPVRILKRGVNVTRALAFGLAGKKLVFLANKADIRTNQGFSGIYHFKGNYEKRFQRFIQQSVNGGMIMCHPGLVDQPLLDVDELTWQREEEYRFFASERFFDILASSGHKIGRLKDALD